MFPDENQSLAGLTYSQFSHHTGIIYFLYVSILLLRILIDSILIFFFFYDRLSMHFTVTFLSLHTAKIKVMSSKASLAIFLLCNELKSAQVKQVQYTTALQKKVL